MILATKLYAPQVRPNLVPRPQLLARLNATLERTPGVILLSAPPGSGKTTLLSEWLADFRFAISDFPAQAAGLRGIEAASEVIVQNQQSKIRNNFV